MRLSSSCVRVAAWCVVCLSGAGVEMALAQDSAGSGSSAESADRPTRRERELEEMVRRLSERVEMLESQMAEMRANQAVAGQETSSAAARGDAQAASQSREPDATQGAAGQGAAARVDMSDLLKRLSRLEAGRESSGQGGPPEMSEEEWQRIRDTVALFSEGHTFRTFWRDSLRFESRDKSFKFKLGGRLHWDWSFFRANNGIERRVGELDDGTEFRRARLAVAGTVYDDFEFKLQFDFAGGDTDFKDVYMGIKNVRFVHNVRIGRFKEPFSLEEMGSSNDNTFMERGLHNVFAPSRNSGFMIHDTAMDQRMTWAVGVFRETDDFGGGDANRDYNVTARVTGLPVYRDGGRELVHVGFAYTHKNFEDDTARFRARPEAHRSPRLVDTGEFQAEYADIVGAELAWVNGPFSLEGEYVQAFIQSNRSTDPTFWGASVQASYFLTGEHRPYDRKNAVFGRVHPIHNLGKQGWGAWEVAARYSHLDLNSAKVKGGELHDFTVGLNWYWNANMRVLMNYARAGRTSGGSLDVFQLRFQTAF